LSGWNAEEEIKHEDFSTVQKAVRLINNCLRNGVPILVHCHAGIDRGPFIVACYLHEIYGDSPSESYDWVKSLHPQTIIHDDWMKAYQSSGETANVE